MLLLPGPAMTQQTAAAAEKGGGGVVSILSQLTFVSDPHRGHPGDLAHTTAS